MAGGPEAVGHLTRATATGKPAGGRAAAGPAVASVVSRLDSRNPSPACASVTKPLLPLPPSAHWRARAAAMAGLVAALFVYILYAQHVSSNVISDWDPTWV